MLPPRLTHLIEGSGALAGAVVASIPGLSGGMPKTPEQWGMMIGTLLGLSTLFFLVVRMLTSWAINLWTSRMEEQEGSREKALAALTTQVQKLDTNLDAAKREIYGRFDRLERQLGEHLAGDREWKRATEHRVDTNAADIKALEQRPR